MAARSNVLCAKSIEIDRTSKIARHLGHFSILSWQNSDVKMYSE